MTFSRFYWNSKWPPQININFLGGVKTQKICLVNFFFNFNITFLATWGWANMGMCKWFFKDATKFQNGRQRSTPTFFVGVKTKIIRILLSHSPRYGDVQVTFSRFYWNSKLPPWINSIFSCGRKNWKIQISYNSHCTMTLPTIWKCACDFTEI